MLSQETLVGAPGQTNKFERCLRDLFQLCPGPCLLKLNGQKYASTLHKVCQWWCGLSTPLWPVLIRSCLHCFRSFCPWVAAGKAEAGESDSVCGWQWCLSSLAAHWDKDQDPAERNPSPLQVQLFGLVYTSCGSGHKQRLRLTQHFLYALQGQSQRLRQALAALSST